MAIRRTARARRKQLTPEPTSQLVDSTLKHLRLDEMVRSMRAMRAFGEIAGARIRGRARAERLRGRTLVIRVASSAWSQELHVLRASILERLRVTPGGEDVEELRFQVGDVLGLPDWTELAPRQPTPPTKAEPVPAGLHQALSEIPDPDLRDRFTALLGRAHQRGK